MAMYSRLVYSYKGGLTFEYIESCPHPNLMIIILEIGIIHRDIDKANKAAARR